MLGNPTISCHDLAGNATTKPPGGCANGTSAHLSNTPCCCSATPAGAGGKHCGAAGCLACPASGAQVPSAQPSQHTAGLLPRNETALFLHRSWRACLPAPTSSMGAAVCTLAAGAPSCSKEPSPKGMAPGGSATTSLHQCASVIRHKVQTTNLKCPWGDASPRKRPRFCAQHSYPNTHSLGCTCWLEPSPLLATIACSTAWSVSKSCSRWCWASSSRHGAGCISGEEAA